MSATFAERLLFAKDATDMPLDLTSIERIQSLEDAKLWMASHDGQVQAWWDEQHRQNRTNDAKHDAFVDRLTQNESRTDKRFEALHARVSSLERRVMLVAGTSSGLAGLLGAGLGVRLLSG